VSAPLLGLLLLASAATAEPVRAAYELSWNRLEIGAVEAELTRSDAGYRVVWHGRTSGFLGVLYPFGSTAWSEGSEAGSNLAPRLHAGRSRRGDEESAWAVDFDGSGRAVRIEVPAQDRAEREPVPPALQIGPDPLSLALTALGRAGPGARESGMAFDGRRAVRLDAACADELELLPGTGEALPCTIEGRLIAGASRRWRDRQRPDGGRPPARVWLARDIVTDGWWPVRIEATTRWGVVTARLISPVAPRRRAVWRGPTPKSRLMVSELPIW
jgi:hypothetical protein